VRTYPSHSSSLYTLNPKCTGCEYPNNTSQQHGFQASTTVCGHSIHFRYVSGQMGMAEPNEKALIGRSKTKTSEQSGADWNNGIKIEKGVILLQYYCTNISFLFILNFIYKL
jgi:hypothetical protein